MALLVHCRFSTFKKKLQSVIRLRLSVYVQGRAGRFPVPAQGHINVLFQDTFLVYTYIFINCIFIPPYWR